LSPEYHSVLDDIGNHLNDISFKFEPNFIRNNATFVAYRYMFMEESFPTWSRCVLYTFILIDI
jgi:hypothetical protein